MADPKGEKPESDHPHEDDLPLELHLDQEGLPAAGDEGYPLEETFDLSVSTEDTLPLEAPPDQEVVPAAGEESPLSALGLSASTEDFHFSGPAEELDFTEPADFTFPSEQAAEAEVASESPADFAAGEPAGVESFFGAEEGFGAEEFSSAESPLPEEAAVEPELAGEGIAEVELAEEPAEEEERPKPKFESPAWLRTVEFMPSACWSCACRWPLFSPSSGSKTPSTSRSS